MKIIITALFLVLALIHLLPALAVFAPSRMAALYGVTPGDTGLITLLHHRALLFGLLCTALVLAAYSPTYRWPVLIGAVISMAGFIAIAALHKELGGALKKIVVADVIGLCVAACAALLLLKS